jgi:hypothetical protein
VRKIQSLEFVEMWDLLPENITLAERLEALPSHRSSANAPETREVGALATWVTAFTTYIAIVAVAHPGRDAGLHAPSGLGSPEVWRHQVDHQ